MDTQSLPVRPKEAVGAILKNLPNKRLRDVVERRFGVKGAGMTLDAIGKIYDITRERVRQIEYDALKHLRKPAVVSYLAPVFHALTSYVKERGGVVAHREFLESLGEKSDRAPLEVLLALHPELSVVPESDEYHTRVSSGKSALSASENVTADVVKKLNTAAHPFSREELESAFAASYVAVHGVRPSVQTIGAHLACTKLIARNPYHEYGISSWPTIRPKSIRDKAYVVLFKSGKPMHFSTVATAIDASGFGGKKKAHPQTVHNELIKDSQKFVLVGRGLYALKEWGYEEGTVRDVIRGILRMESKPMPREAIIQAVMQKRFVKENTIMLNLQNKEHFKKFENGTYDIA